MFNVIKKEIIWGGKNLSIETGKIGRQASSVIARMGNTVVMANVTTASKETTGIDFTPLTITYVEKFYAIGQIPQGFVKRETKPSDHEVLIARLIDRPIRPLFPSNYRYETNVFCTLLSHDDEVPAEVVASIAASAALTISKARFEGPTAGVKVGYVDGKFVLNPTKPFENNGKLDLSVAGTEDSVLMVESEVKELSEETMLEAVKFGHNALKEVVAMIKEFASECNVEKLEMTEEDNSALEKEIIDFCKNDVVDAYSTVKKQERESKLNEIKDKVFEKFVGEDADEKLQNTVEFILEELKKNIVRSKILDTGKRIDGRAINEVRPIKAEIDILPVVHGSSLFTRGETQSLSVLTLGSAEDEQVIDGVSRRDDSERFMLHYNFPPYAVGECGKLGSPGRREIGHGKLAWRALNNMIASKEKFPYTIRLVSEITESNGSSSMATVCAGCLALMAGGVPMKAPVAGIAMGLIKEEDKFTVLTDIMGDEDHLGDMDFKVAGTKDAITALQMDIKCKGVTPEIMSVALKQAKEGRLHILGKMAEAITESRKEVSENAPKMVTIKINPEKIRELIGPQGKIIKNLTEVTDTNIDIEDNGNVKVFGSNLAKVELALKMIDDIVFEPIVGRIYNGVVDKIIDSGAFVSLTDKVDGFVHISELANYRIDFVDDILTEGKTIKVKVIGFDRKGKPKLSYKAVDQKTGEDLEK